MWSSEYVTVFKIKKTSVKWEGKKQGKTNKKEREREGQRKRENDIQKEGNVREKEKIK